MGEPAERGRRPHASAVIGRRKGEGMSDHDLCYLSVHELAGPMRQRKISPVEVLEAHLRRIEELMA